MTDLTQARSLTELDPRTKKRNAAEKRFRAYGVSAIAIGVVFLVILLWNIISAGLPAYTQTSLKLDVALTQEEVDKAESAVVKTTRYRKMIEAAMVAALQDQGIENPFSKSRDLVRMLSTGAPATLRDAVLADPSLVGQTSQFEFFMSSRADGYMKGRVTREDLARDKNLTPLHLDVIDRLVDAGMVERGFNWNFIFGVDASEARPEQAGMGASILGSFYMMMVVLMAAVPIGVATAIYLEEFAPQNWFTDLIEINISNLAAVPSIVFGILGIAAFIQFGGGVMGIAGFKQSVPLVGGLVLSLMTLPTIIIATRASLKAVPPSIRDAALGLGASKTQAVFHHVLPLALPGILTGTIIGLAQALGETAPLLLIGMIGLVATSYPEGFVSGFTEPNSAMPAQIYQWATRADPAFYERAWGGIIILLVFLLSMNIIAIILRRRFERRW